MEAQAKTNETMSKKLDRLLDRFLASGEGLSLADLVPFRKYDNVIIPDNYPPDDPIERFPRGARVEILPGYKIKEGIKARVVFTERYNGYNRYYILIDGMDKHAHHARHKDLKVLDTDDGTNLDRVRDYDYLYTNLGLIPETVKQQTN